MTPTPKSVSSTTKTRVLAAAFALIIGGFFVANFVVLYLGQNIQNANQRIMEDVQSRVELLSRITREFDRNRLLLAEHVIQKTSAEMRGIESQMARVEANLSAALASYQALVGDHAESAALQEIQSELTDMHADVVKVLALSRQNLDLEALAEMGRIVQQVAVIDQSITSLGKVTRDEANRSMGLTFARQQRIRLIFGILTLAGTVLGMVIAGWMIRLARRYETQLRQAAALLEERIRDLNAFAGRVAHDLRGPLSIISLSASRLSEGVPREEGTAAVLRRGVAQMESTIQDLLTLSRIDAQAPGSVADPAAVIETVAEDLRQSVESVQGTLHIEAVPDEVRCSAGLLRQALWNLADNAVKYRRTDVQLALYLKGRKLGSNYEFRVTDNGSGMSSDVVRHAFEPFFRGEHDRATPGTGLGLSIVKRVIEANGGSVSVQSQLGQGTTFVINLPRAGPGR